MVDLLARRAEAKRLSVQEARDGLVWWFVRRAEPQARRGMRYTAPEAPPEAVRRLLTQRAERFFARLASGWSEPTWADLRRVKARMQSYLLPGRADRRALSRENDLWDYVLGGPPPART